MPSVEWRSNEHIKERELYLGLSISVGRRVVCRSLPSVECATEGGGRGVDFLLLCSPSVLVGVGAPYALYRLRCTVKPYGNRNIYSENTEPAEQSSDSRLKGPAV